ncbi:MAG: 3-methyl-2-oxobutanoate hydroxymethyltransferase [Myxococcales bacterium]|nr:3-methyl-2-oxobutanoate hydroxymethyltransferase [Myxococcales bacterium]MCB9567843.1 3-methyl-2-oxobutanoate hydroxymethyltransferase [Myxococcales bacterium]MCB9700288.1 3-methyl-2-oxobutanoate hydroxymethyltransferase [Myxococcales bacterium]
MTSEATQAKATPPGRGRVTAPELGRLKRDGQAIVMVTAYDATFGRLVDEAGVDVILVGDSLGMVMQGHPHTLEVTLDHMIYHSRCVRRAVQRALLVADMPFMSYQVSPELALISAGRLIQEGGAEAVKLEGGGREETVRRIVSAGIPVMGHLGLTPQSVHEFGGFRVQAREDAAAERLRRDALGLQEAGAFALVIEGVPAPLAEEVSRSLAIPTIGIGAGVGCDGQVLVIQDLLGLEDRFKPRFVKRFAELADTVREAVGEYASEVRERRFPGDEHSFSAAKREPAPASAAAGAGYGPR